MLKPLERLTIAAAAVALAPRLLHRGMFFDGVTYATLSRNLAAGRGRFWEPFYTETLLPKYHDNPPLAIGLQSLWFRVLGDHLYVERLYDAVCTVAVVLLIVAIWRRLLPRSEPSGTAWLPVLLWLAPPIASWTMVGNMLETTLIVFTTASVAAIVIAVDSHARRRTIAWGVVSGACIAAAALTKGPVAFFPLAAPVLLILLGDRRDRPLERCALCLGGQLLALSVAAIGIIAWPEARTSLSAYFSRQLVPALVGSGNPNPVPRLQVLSVLVQQVIVSLGVLAAVMLALARRFVVPIPSDRRWGVAFLMLALAATLPIVVSTKQTGYYFAPAIPFYAIGVGLLMRRTALVLAERARLAINGVAALLAMAAIVGSLTGTGRDRVLMAELDRLEHDLPRNETIRICAASATDWTLHAWFARRFALSLDPVDVPRPGLFLQTGGQPGCAPVTCEALSKPDAWLVLRRCG